MTADDLARTGMGEPPLHERLGRRLLVAAAMLGGLLLLLGLFTGEGGAAESRPAPAFDLAMLQGDGRVTLEDLDGRVAVVNVWASWCPPCREEAPALRRVHERSDASRVAFLGVAHNDRAEDARGFVADFDVAFPNALDDGSFGRAYGVRGLPMTFVIDAGGHITAAHYGPISESRLTVLVEDALSRSAAAP